MNKLIHQLAWLCLSVTVAIKGVVKHIDHVHVEIYKPAAGDRRTKFDDRDFDLDDSKP